MLVRKVTWIGRWKKGGAGTLAEDWTGEIIFCSMRRGEDCGCGNESGCWQSKLSLDADLKENTTTHTVFVVIGIEFAVDIISSINWAEGRTKAVRDRVTCISQS